MRNSLQNVFFAHIMDFRTYGTLEPQGFIHFFRFFPQKLTKKKSQFDLLIYYMTYIRKNIHTKLEIIYRFIIIKAIYQ